MPKTITVRDTGDALNKLFADVAQLKQQVTSPVVMGGGGSEFDEVVITDPSGIKPPAPLNLKISPIEPAEGQTPEAPLLITTEAFEDRVFIDVAWSAPSDGTAATYEVQMMKQEEGDFFSLPTIQITGSTSVRFTNVEPNTTYGFRVIAVNAIGIRSPAVPETIQTISTGKDTTIPPQVSAPVLTRGATSLVVNFQAITEEQASDVANGKGLYEVQIATNSAFTANFRSLIGSASIVAFSDLNFAATWYVRVRAIDQSGNAGPWSEVSTLLAGSITSEQIGEGAITETKIGPNSISTGKIQTDAILARHVAAGQINSDKITAAGLDAAVIKFGSMSGDRVQANSLSASTIKTSNLNVGIITISSGGGIFAGTSGTGVMFSAAGLRLYKNNDEMIVLDATTGNATFRGLVESTTIRSSFINFTGGSLSDSFGLLFSVNNNGYLQNRAISWQSLTSPYAVQWTIYAANASELYIARTNMASGQYASFYVRSNRTYFDSNNGSSIGYFYWSGNGTGSNGLSLSGTFYAPSKSFIIDHPLAPEEKLLVHGCIEGPELGVYYRGNAQIGEDGTVEVELPDYFEALTSKENRTVQVTPLGTHTDLYAELPSEGKFVVGGRPGAKFSWTVFAERDDVDPLQTVLDKEELAAADELAQHGFFNKEVLEEDASSPTRGACGTDPRRGDQGRTGGGYQLARPSSN